MQFTDKTIILATFHEFELFTIFLEQDMRSKIEADWLCTLAKDLKNEKNAILCRAEKQIDSHIFSLLEKVQDRNPEFIFNIEIWKNKEIKENLIEVIKNAFLVQMNAQYIIDKTGKPIFDYYDDQFLHMVGLALDSEPILYSFFEPPFFNLNTKNGGYAFGKTILMGIRRALFAMGIYFTSKEEKDDNFSKNLLLAALMSSFDQSEIETKKLKEAHYRKKAIEITKDNKEKYLKKMDLPPVVGKAIDHLNESILAGNYAYIDLDDEAATLAQIAAVGIQFEQLISVESETSMQGSRALDIIYLLTKSNKLKQQPVDNLAHWLEMKEVFRFYKTLERLENSCKFGPNGSNLAVPYPMRGIGSPTLFVCKENHTDCDHLSSAFKKINIQEATYKLRYGAYTKCIWLTKELQEYYKKYYSKIKEETGTQDSLDQS
ncbi:MAG: hypothetical protein DWQ10_16105 [Calditrichaeota bacterium]|nr:MAG: hypothetical protein DWQ10_16105 [Calditrichota bacterium]